MRVPDENSDESEVTPDAEESPSSEETSRRLRHQSKHRLKRRRGVAFWIGLALLLAGIGTLAWLAWQIWGTNWISQREQHKEIELFEKNAPGGPPALLKIPALGKDYVVPINDMPPSPEDPAGSLSCSAPSR